jgi:hypothetical protein
VQDDHRYPYKDPRDETRPLLQWGIAFRSRDFLDRARVREAELLGLFRKR